MKKRNRLRLCGALLATFLKIGAFTFGGGYAMIPLIQRETIEKHHWITNEDILDITAIAESTPGPIAVNSATFIGYHIAGVPGAFCATLGVVLPSFLIILGLSFVLRQFEELKWVTYAFMGIRAGVLALIVKALFTMGSACPKNTFSYCLMAGAFAAVALFGANVLLVIVCCALCGIAASLLPKNRRAEK